MRAIVFGGAGFLGSHVVDELKARGHEVTVFDLIDGHDIMSGIFELGEADVVYNFAGISDLNYAINHPHDTMELNIIGNLNVLESARRARVKRYVYASTVYAASKKGSFYGISKHCSERVIEATGVPYTILRYGSVYGPRSDHSNRIHRMIFQALMNMAVTYEGSGDEEREYIHVRDAARLSVDILAPEYENRTVVLTGSERYSYKTILKMLQEMMGAKTMISGNDYEGHYAITPYSYQPDTPQKLTANPYTDFGQGLLETIEDISARIRKES